MIVMLVTLNVNAFAAPGSFVSSPSGNPMPQLISFVPGDSGCTATLIITPYSERDTLPADLQTLMNKAYSEIATSNDLTELEAELAKLAASKSIKGTDLAVSDLFDMRTVGCDVHVHHNSFTITLSAETLKRFVGLLHMTTDGEWELISNAKVLDEGKTLQFTVDDFSPFAIVVDTSENGGPNTGDNSMIHVYITVMAICAVAIVVIVAMDRKRRA